MVRVYWLFAAVASFWGREPVTQTLVVERRVVDGRPTAVVRVVDTGD